MDRWRKAELSAWQRVAAARARGETPDPADVEEARRRARRGGVPSWAEAVALKLTGGQGEPVAPTRADPEPEPEDRMVLALERRLGVRPAGDGPPAA